MDILMLDSEKAIKHSLNAISALWYNYEGTT